MANRNFSLDRSANVPYTDDLIGKEPANKGGVAVTDSNLPQTSPQGFNQARYRVYVDSFDITEQQKSELLQAVWDIMKMFVEMGFDVPSCDDLLEAFNREGEPS